MSVSPGGPLPGAETRHMGECGRGRGACLAAVSAQTPPPTQGRPAGPALPGDTWDHQLTWVPHNWDCASHRVQARICLRDGASSTRRLEATGCGTGCSRGRVGRGPHDARTRYKYLQVSLRKKLSIRSSLDLSMTWCSVA